MVIATSTRRARRSNRHVAVVIATEILSLGGSGDTGSDETNPSRDSMAVEDIDMGRSSGQASASLAQSDRH